MRPPARIFFLLTIFFLSQAFARDFQKIYIPEAQCADGSDYFVLIDKRAETKLTIEFMGGGACWDAASCYGPLLRTWIHPLPLNFAFSVPADESSVIGSKLRAHSYLFFPYCTGDTHIGTHSAFYLPVFETKHHGSLNLQKSLRFLTDHNFIHLENVTDVVVWGASAGALGSFFHAPQIEAMVRPTAHKVLLMDSPGLHFGEAFWGKFSLEMFGDFQTSLQKIDIEIDKNKGFVAQDLPRAYRALKNWKIGIYQGTKDIAMSSVFGNITPKQHRELVLSDNGVARNAANFDNVKFWIADSYMHTFLLLNISAKMKNMDDTQTAEEFTLEVLKSK